MKLERIVPAEPCAAEVAEAHLRLTGATVSAHHLVMLLLTGLLVTNQLLLVFLGVGPAIALASLAASGGLLVFMLRLPVRVKGLVPVSRLAGCIVWQHLS
jgi:hypothetical protein